MVIVGGCITLPDSTGNSDATTTIETSSPVTSTVEAESLSELQITACDSADSAGTCDKLAGLGIVTTEECCQALKKCCS